MSKPLIPLLRSLPATQAVLKSGAYLFHAGDPVRVMHLVEDGIVHLIRHHATGGTLILQRAGPGAVVAEASLFAPR